MRDAAPRAIELKDYRPPEFLVGSAQLEFDLDPARTRVRSRLELRRNPSGQRDAPLVLDGQGLKLRRVSRDGYPMRPSEYEVTADTLTIPGLPDAVCIETEVEIDPSANSALEGLYTSRGMLCTQCEAEGFRCITYFPDRPDVLARFTTTLRADRGAYPLLLSNGNRVAEGELPDGRHYATFDDPFPKPCYLFALVAGQLEALTDTFVTASGRTVQLYIHTEPAYVAQCGHAMAALRKAMAWDERVYGREYDLDVFHIVAVDDFNMGAMETKGLNIFNAKYVMAEPSRATDLDYQYIEGIIAHEYFHNWTGNRITCRDWFQLSLKEGLTVFRDQQFSADMGSPAVKRIADVRNLRTVQFAEDGGPLAHPVRPQAYVEINNFYTSTVYQKGAEVVRMLHTVLGPQGFRRGMDCYFARHDGQAVTVEDFVAALADANDVDLEPFMGWYRQAGTPQLTVQHRHDPSAQRYYLTLSQHTPPTPGQPDKQPLPIPVALGLLAADGRELPLRLEGEATATGTQRVLQLREAEQTFVFEDIPAPPVPSLLRGFSAPVRLQIDFDDVQLAHLLAHDTDPCARYDAGQLLYLRLIRRLLAAHGKGEALWLDDGLLAAVQRCLTDTSLDPALVTELLTLPSETFIAGELDVVDPQAIHEVRRFLRLALAQALREPLLERYKALAPTGPYQFEGAQVGRRSLRNLCLGYLAELDDIGAVLCLTQFQAADNMTDSNAALALLAQLDAPEREQALAAFYQRWQGEAIVLDRWFSVQAGSRRLQALDDVKALLNHPAYAPRNPNRVRALVGAFVHGNPARFHAADGSGYAFLADQVLAIDAFNPMLAARLVQAFARWRRFEPGRQALMRAQLERLAAAQLSKDVYEVVSKALA
ncbi:aminopeptidase N [Immundisolibacter sp.]|uniref:aminopeptidase N n=1 Tax=Immundisolibacter sp. TaxID=1934948 RepID=UPI002B0A13C9|nr:aminopeptidase N [Immundisolibacter sp.]MEA3220149.1 Aminopeptidase N [Immundisolibacter sp.]